MDKYFSMSDVSYLFTFIHTMNKQKSIIYIYIIESYIQKMDNEFGRRISYVPS